MLEAAVQPVKADVKSHLVPSVYLAGKLREARRVYRRRLKRSRRHFSERAVHDLRVEMRRLLALLDFLDSDPFGKLPGKIAKALKKRLDAFDDLRDTQVQLQLLQRLWSKFPEAKPFRKLLRRQEAKLVNKARQKVQHVKMGGLWPQLKELEKQIGTAKRKSPAAAPNAALPALQSSFQKAVNLRRRIRGRDAAAIHRLRIAFKRFRYLSELLQPFLPGLTREHCRRMRRFQSSAGAIQDLEVLLTTLAQFGRRKKLPAAAWAGLRRELTRRKHRALDFFMERLDELQEFQPRGWMRKPVALN